MQGIGKASRAPHRPENEEGHRWGWPKCEPRCRGGDYADCMGPQGHRWRWWHMQPLQRAEAGIERCGQRDGRCERPAR